MTAQEAGGAGQDVWLDMSRYPDTDPDTDLTGEEQDLLSTSLAVDDAELPDAVWEHMLAVVTGSDEALVEDDPVTEDGADPAADDPGTWDADPALDVHHDPGDDPADPGDPGADHAWDDGAWDGGAV